MKTFLYHENGWRMFQAEELPVKPIITDIFKSDMSLASRSRIYKSEIAALKAKSIPVGNPEICPQNMSAVKDGQLIEWPGDVEIKFVTENNISIARGRAYREESSSELKQGKKVAILTLPKEQ